MSKDSFIILLPWYPKDVQSNARCHWRKKASAVAKARNDARLCTLAAGARALDWKAVHAHLIFHEPDKRRRDESDMEHACKAYIDGVAEVIGVDDYNWKITRERGLPTKGGQVDMRIEIMDPFDLMPEEEKRKMFRGVSPAKDGK